MRAMAGVTVSDLGKKVALKRAVTRAEPLPGPRSARRRFRPNMREAGRSIPGPVRRRFEPYPRRDSGRPKIEPEGAGAVIRRRSRAPTSSTAPRVVKRGEMALLLEDMVIRISGDQKIASAYLGMRSRPSSTYAHLPVL